MFILILICLLLLPANPALGLTNPTFGKNSPNLSNPSPVLGGAKTDDLSLSGQIFLRYSKGLTNSSPASTFDVDRAYLTFAGPVGKNAKAQITLDSARDTGKLDTFLKYAYLDLNHAAFLTTRMGLLPTYWSPWVDKFLGLRIVSKSLSELDAEIPSSDFGLAAYGTAAPNELITTNYFISVANGTGYSQAENNTGKNIAIRLDGKPHSAITLAIGGQIEDASRSGSGNTLGNALIGCQAGIGRGYVEFLSGKTAVGYSVAGMIDLHALEAMLPYELFARLDNYDPDKTASSDDRVRVIVGTTYLFNGQVKLLADYNNITYGAAAPAYAGQTISAVSLRTQVDF